MTFYVVECIPKKGSLVSEQDGIKRLLNGPGKSEMQQLFWVAQAAVGVADNRTPTYAKFRQKIMVFSCKQKASQERRKHENEFWSAKVREVRFIQ